jgi:hypothetical protein
MLFRPIWRLTRLRVGKFPASFESARRGRLRAARPLALANSSFEQVARPPVYRLTSECTSALRRSLGPPAAADKTRFRSTSAQSRRSNPSRYRRSNAQKSIRSERFRTVLLLRCVRRWRLHRNRRGDRLFLVQVEAAIRAAKNLLWENLPPTHNLLAAVTVTRVRELVHLPSLQSALQRSSDTFLTFALRAVEQVVANRSQTDRQIINRLWDILDDPHLNQALGIPQNSRMTLGPYPKRR